MLAQEPFTGVYLGNNVYKIRLAISSKTRGKSGGARVMTKVRIDSDSIYLFSIYDKGDQDDIADSVILSLLKELDDEFPE